MLNDLYLDESWRIVVIATSGDTNLLRDTLTELEAKSYSTNISILAVDDRSLKPYLDQLDYPVSCGLPTSISAGSFWATTLSGFEFNHEKTVFLQAGVKVPPHWDARLIAAGRRAEGVSAVSPLCSKHPLLSAFFDPSHEPGLSCDEIDQWLSDYVDGIEFSVPVMLESCVLLQGHAWQQLEQFDNDAQLLESLRLDGHYLVATDQLYIEDIRVAYPTELDFLPQAFRNAFSGRHPLTDTRHALMELSGRHEKPLELRSCLPVQLHVGHSWGGGLGRWIEDFIEADTSHNHLVLRSIGDLSGFGQSIALYHSAQIGVPLRTWVLSEPIMSTTLSHYEYQKLLAEIVSEYSVESLIISSLIGHSLDLLRTDLPTTYVFHEFFPFCPALYATFGDACRSCTTSDLSECAKSNPLHSFFKFESDAHWLSVRSAFIDLITDRKIVAVAPTRSVAERYRQLEPRLVDKTLNIIEHGLERTLVDSLVLPGRSASRDPSQRLKIVILGRLTSEKGGDLAKEIIEPISNIADIWLLGVGESGARFVGTQNTTIVPEYKKSELGDYMRTIDPDLGLLLSIVPETFSYTLSELWASGIPVLATRLGAFKDRIADSQNGWLVDARGDQIVDKIRELDDDREEIARTGLALQQQTIRCASDMTSEYNALEIQAERIPVSRYYLPRRSHQNPYKKKLQEERALYIGEPATYGSVLTEFLSYTSDKLNQSPRLPRPIATLLRRILAYAITLLSRKNAIHYHQESKQTLTGSEQE